MVTIAQRIVALRNEKNISCVELAAALKLPRLSVDKIESGRLTPSKEQVKKIASFFGVSEEYLRGESDDRQTLGTWLSGDFPAEPEPAPVRPAPQQRVVAQTGSSGKEDSAVFSLLLKSDAFQKAVLEVLKSPEGQKLLEQAVARELRKK